ncbi:MAG TPA: hypothetical protein PKA63_00850 [Oligoflexia bacterium]|nr:hypothetical protein [Oligoflexia bacterium]HMP47198.1 hypothetical protein [Oligoflexia bacterium]
MIFKKKSEISSIEEVLPEEQPFEHKVLSSNENLKELSDWYTGDAGNWKILMNYNGKTNDSKLKPGEIIFIPYEILYRTDRYVKKRLTKSIKKNVELSVDKSRSLNEVTVGNDIKGSDETLDSPDLDEISKVDSLKEESGRSGDYTSEISSGVSSGSVEVSVKADTDMLEGEENVNNRESSGTLSPVNNPDSAINHPNGSREHQRIRLLNELLLQ